MPTRLEFNSQFELGQFVGPALDRMLAVRHQGDADRVAFTGQAWRDRIVGLPVPGPHRVSLTGAANAPAGVGRPR